MAASRDVIHRSYYYKTFVRAAIAKCLSDDAIAYAEKRWGDDNSSTLLLKSSQGALTSATPVASLDGADSEFIGMVNQLHVLGRVPNFRRVPFYERIISMVAGARGYWSAGGRPIPVVKPSVLGSSLSRKRNGCIVVSTKPSLENPQAENRVESDMVRAVAASYDEALLNPANDGSDDSPASILYGVSPIPSVGPAEDIAALIDGFAGDFSEAIIVTDPLTATRLALYRDAGGSFPFASAGPRGGDVLGIPLYTTTGSTIDSNGAQLALIDPTCVAWALDSIELSKSDVTTLVMADDPESPSVSQVSMYQTESVAMKIISYINWENQRSGAAAFVNGINYGAS